MTGPLDPKLEPEQWLAADAAIASFHGISCDVACVVSRRAAEAKRYDPARIKYFFPHVMKLIF
jgi:hypothetical protein